GSRDADAALHFNRARNLHDPAFGPGRVDGSRDADAALHFNRARNLHDPAFGPGRVHRPRDADAALHFNRARNLDHPAFRPGRVHRPRHVDHAIDRHGLLDRHAIDHRPRAGHLFRRRRARVVAAAGAWVTARHTNAPATSLHFRDLPSLAGVTGNLLLLRYNLPFHHGVSTGHLHLLGHTFRDLPRLADNL